jgi:hypothetical protein
MSPDPRHHSRRARPATTPTRRCARSRKRRPNRGPDRPPHTLVHPCGKSASAMTREPIRSAAVDRTRFLPPKNPMGTTGSGKRNQIPLRLNPVDSEKWKIETMIQHAEMPIYDIRATTGKYGEFSTRKGRRCDGKNRRDESTMTITAANNQCCASPGPVRVAFYGRVACCDTSGALLSILFQSRPITPCGSSPHPPLCVQGPHDTRHLRTEGARQLVPRRGLLPLPLPTGICHRQQPRARSGSPANVRTSRP